MAPHVQTTNTQRRDHDHRQQPIPCTTPGPPRTRERSETPDAPEEENKKIPRSGALTKFQMLWRVTTRSKSIHLSEDSSEDTELDDMTPDERDVILTQYKKIMQLIPSINEDAQSYREDPDALCDVIRYIQRHAADGRSDDLGTLKPKILGYLPLKAPNAPSLESLTLSKGKRGWAHHQTARLLCPRSLVEKFDPDPDRSIHWSANGNKKGVWTIRRWSSIKDKDIQDDQGHARAHFLICGQDSWDPQDGMFSLPNFYQAIMDLFDDPTNPWYIDTLAWWNKYLL
ncbi:hypothetical protein PHLCEN_2v11590 [Hermanssonia centrifuga]|uniref:Uncharacterized protein n=1 Tax=Hermanssonia centrifuga TaxID=98765 RepID=A0A2R6NJI5_9APHY|nr:hypothetical protein PHLCEN_2v11590 [Hermanssonia centrifuga]